MKKNKYESIRKLSEEDRKEVLEFAIKRSEEILSGKDDDVTNRTWLNDILDEVNEEVSKWPDWKFSQETREAIKKKKSTNSVIRELKQSIIDTVENKLDRVLAEWLDQNVQKKDRVKIDVNSSVIDEGDQKSGIYSTSSKIEDEISILKLNLECTIERIR